MCFSTSEPSVLRSTAESEPSIGEIIVKCCADYVIDFICTFLALVPYSLLERLLCVPWYASWYLLHHGVSFAHDVTPSSLFLSPFSFSSTLRDMMAVRIAYSRYSPLLLHRDMYSCTCM